MPQKSNKTKSSTSDKQQINVTKSTTGLQKPEKKKTVIWESSLVNSQDNIKLNLFTANNTYKSTLQRPKSAVHVKASEPKSIINENIVSVNNEEAQSSKIDLKKSNSNLFLNYARLNEIESNIDKEENSHIPASRPKSAFEARQTESVELNFDLPVLSSYLQIPLVQSNEIDSKNDIEPLKIEVTTTLKQDAKRNPSTHDWCDLPQEIWLNILKYLPHKDLIQFGRCCKTFKQMYSDNSLCKC